MGLGKYIWILFLVGLLPGCNDSVKKLNGENVSFEWHQSYLGGGGYITGLVQHPDDPQVIFARCDVAGLFKSEDAGNEWKLVNRGLKHGFNQNTETVCISPHNPQIMFRGSGEARKHQMVGEIHKSTDGGENWYSVSQDVDFFGNGPNRPYGERIEVDPFHSDFIAAGGYSRGVWISHNTGETWQYSGLRDEPITNLVFHPYRKGYLYVATLHEMRMKDYFLKDREYNRPQNGRLYRSTDFGKTWELLYEKENVGFTQLDFFPGNPDKIIASTCTHGIMISKNGGRTFQAKNNGLPRQVKRYNTVAVDKGNPDVIYTAPSRRGYDDEVPLVPVYRSVDGGETWNMVADYSEGDFMNYPSYIKTQEHIGWAISSIIVDEMVEGRLFMANWYGVSVSDDAGLSWNGNNFKGTETVCIENLIVDPVVRGRSGFVMPDHRPFIGSDFGESYQQVPAVTDYKNSTAMVFSRFNSSHILFAGKRDWMGENGSAILLSRDNGKTFGVVKAFENFLTVQALKEDYHTPGVFYAYVDRSLEHGSGLYKSSNWGETWERLNTDLPGHIETLPHHMNFIENELLPVTYGQQKNVCGTNQLLCVDPHKKKTLYFGEWTEGLFRVENDGEVWKDISGGLPFNNDSTSVLVDIKADEKVPGLLYAGFIREGLWRSTNYGESWEKIYPKDNTVFNASSISVGGFTKNELIVASEPLFWSPGESGIFVSDDKGETWKNIYDNSYGALRWKSVGVDPFDGTIYGVTVGNGAFYAKRKLN